MTRLKFLSTHLKLIIRIVLAGLLPRLAERLLPGITTGVKTLKGSEVWNGDSQPMA
jgi:hypothetical protein